MKQEEDRAAAWQKGYVHLSKPLLQQEDWGLLSDTDDGVHSNNVLCFSCEEPPRPREIPAGSPSEVRGSGWLPSCRRFLPEPWPHLCFPLLLTLTPSKVTPAFS